MSVQDSSSQNSTQDLVPRLWECSDQILLLGWQTWGGNGRWKSIFWSQIWVTFFALLHSFKINDVRRQIVLTNGQKIWTDTSPTKIYRRQTSPWKYSQHHYSLEPHKLKSRWDTVVHPLEWLKFGRLTMPSISEHGILLRWCKYSELLLWWPLPNYTHLSKLSKLYI